MTAPLLLEPHQDDACLFACWTLLREKPHVVTILQSDLQARRGTGITASQRVAENELALVNVLGLTWEQWEFSDADPDWEAIRAELYLLDARSSEAVDVYAPAIEPEGGHPHHDKLGRLADEVFGAARVTHYTTYRWGHGRSGGSGYQEVLPADPDHVRMKLLALACYGTQIREPSTGHHWMQGLWEWYA